MKRAWIMMGPAFLAGCSSLGNQLSDIVFIPTAGSDVREGEQVSLEFAYSSKAPLRVGEEGRDRGDEGFESSEVPGARTGPGTLAEIVIATISQTLTEEAKRYEATYSSEAVSDQFYHYSTPQVDHRRPAGSYTETDIKFSGFKVSRSVTVNGQQQAALTVCGVVLPGQADAFFFVVPVSYSINYTKAKLVGFDLTSPFGVDVLNPWEIVTDPLSGRRLTFGPNDNDVDLNLAITFEFLHFKDNALATTKVGPYTVVSRSVSLSPGKRSGYFDGYTGFLQAGGSDYALACNDSTSLADISLLRDKIQGLPQDSAQRMRLVSQAKLFSSPPRAFEGGKFGNGNFTMKVQATEFDSYGKRVKEVSSAFEEQKDSAQQKLTNFLSQ